MRRTRSLYAVAAVAVALGSTGRAELVDRVAAVVNNEVVALSEVEARAEVELQRTRSLPPAERGKVRQQILEQALEVVIGEKLLEAQLKELNIDVAPQEVQASIDELRKQNNLTDEQFEQAIRQEGYSIETYKSYVRRHLARMKLINLKVRSKVKIADEDLKAEYAKWARQEEADPEVHARHIVVQVPPNAKPEELERTRRKAQALAEEARKPGVNFAELAKRKSEGSSAADGGDLGFFKRGLMEAEFDKVVFKLKPGEVSDPVRTSRAWHVVKVEERRAATPKSFEEVKEELRDRVFRNQMEKFTADYVKELKQTASIEKKI
jgi:peptidyl-prolyl cis-trans isomerase SurA